MCRCFTNRNMTERINENTDRMSELIASSFDGTRAGSRLAASRVSSPVRPQSVTSSGSARGQGQSGRPTSALSHITLASEDAPDDDEPPEIFRTQTPMSSYTTAFSVRSTKWGAPPRNPFTRLPGSKQADMLASFQTPKGIQYRQGSAVRRDCDEMSVPSGLPFDVPKQRIDFLLRQLRLLCYRKVKGHGSDVSVREIFRHFDSNKDEDEDGAGIDGPSRCTFPSRVRS